MLSDPFLCLFLYLFWIVVLVEDPNTTHYKIYNRGNQVLILYLLVFYRIHDVQDVHKMFRTSGRKTAHNIKDPAVYLTVDMGYFLSLFVLNLSGGFASVSSDHRSQCHLNLQWSLKTEFAGDYFWMSKENFP